MITMAKTGRPPKNYPQTTEEMIVSNEARKPKKYSRREIMESHKDQISDLVGDLADRLEEAERTKRKVYLQDIDTVKDISLRYIRSCQITGTLPTLSGLALALGVNTDALFRFIRVHSETESGRWFLELKSQFANILNQSALDGSVAPIPAIFTLKASYGWRDDPEPEVRNNDGQEDLTPDAIAAKWQDLPD